MVFSRRQARPECGADPAPGLLRPPARVPRSTSAPSTSSGDEDIAFAERPTHARIPTELHIDPGRRPCGGALRPCSGVCSASGRTARRAPRRGRSVRAHRGGPHPARGLAAVLLSELARNDLHVPFDLREGEEETSPAAPPRRRRGRPWRPVGPPAVWIRPRQLLVSVGALAAFPTSCRVLARRGACSRSDLDIRRPRVVKAVRLPVEAQPHGVADGVGPVDDGPATSAFPR